MTKSWATGEQYDIKFGEQQATITELGACLRAFGDDKGAIIDGHSADEPISGGRGQVLIPWPNRIRDGRYEINGATQQLPISEVKLNNASHGLLRWVNWRAVERTASSVTLTYELHPQPGYQFSLTALMTYTLSASGLDVRMHVTNTGKQPCPFGMGSHPFVTAGTATVDENTFSCPASAYLPSDEQAIPTGKADVADVCDFRTATSLDGVQLNQCFTELDRDDQGIANVDLLRSDTGDGVRVWMDETFDYIMVFTGDTDPSVLRRRRGMAIEPMTCAPDAFNNGMGLQWLEPGQSIAGTWGIKRHSLS